MTERATLAGAEAPASTAGQAKLPGQWRLGAARGGIEVKTFFRDRMAVAFIFGLPAILLVLLGSIFGHQAAAQGVTVGQLFTAGMIAGGIMATSFQYLGIEIATERETGWLKRLSGTPMPRAAYFAGKIVQVMVCTVAETALLMAVGMLFYHLHLPTSPGRWWTFTWVFVLGAAACSLLGIAASSVPRSAARNGVAVITLPFVILQFISGVYVPFNLVPSWLADIASFFPLAWLCQGMRYVFVPKAIVLEPGNTWELGRIALVLTAWIVAGLVLCLTTFRWQNRRDR
jgi:ABC-2 type transport system permease protein